MPRVLITGASRGLGLEFARQYATAGWQVLATCRDPARAPALKELPQTEIHPLDVADFRAIDTLARRLSGTAIDLLLLNAGVMPQPNDNSPVEKVDYAAWPGVFQVNTMGALRTAAAFKPHVAASSRKIVAAISSGGASLSQPRGTSYAYRSSKAALNFCMAALAREWSGLGITVVMLAPGHTRTAMGGPDAPLAPEDTVNRVRSVIEKLSLKDSGRFIGNDGRDNPW